MRDIKIKIHSFIDIITNSSTEIYITTKEKSIDFAKELVIDLLKLSGCDKNIDELFDFKIEDDYLYIVAKNDEKTTINLKEKLEKIFDINAEYNG